MYGKRVGTSGISGQLYETKLLSLLHQRHLGTSGISGQLYVTKLLSLLYLRAFHDDNIEEFQLASHVDDIGAFDDICFRAKVKGRDKPVAVFIQAKHRRRTIKIDLATYFESYLRIRQRFKTYNKDDVLFKGTFDETECLFVIYTNAIVDSGYDSVLGDISSTLHGLIDTGGTVQQPCRSELIIEYFHLLILKDELTSLAARLAEFLMNEDRLEQMLHDELLLRYHVILAQKVLEVSKIQPEGHRIASFRYDFFDTNEDHLKVFKKRLFFEILKRRKIEPADVYKLLSECSADPTDATKLSKVIGTVVSYFNGQLECNIRYIKDVRPQLDTYVSRGTANEATALAAKDILRRQFKVPAAFGNKDLTIRGSDKKTEKRLNHLASKIIDLLDKCEASKMVTIDESLGSGFLQLNGGLAGAIGNIFVLDDNTKLMKITDNKESLGDNAKMLYELLESKDNIHNIHEYRFCIKVNEFPKLSFDLSAYEENLATDFLNKLLFYSDQADNENLENIIKSEIEDYQNDQPIYYQVKTDVIFSKFHDEIQKWWQSPRATCLTRESDLFNRVLSLINNGPLLNIINILYKNKISQYNYTFTEDAVRSLDLQDQHSSTVIIAENTVLTAIKVMQYLKNKQHVMLDLEYIVNLGGNDRRALCTELDQTNKDDVLIFVCDNNMHHSVNAKKNLEHIAKVIVNKKTIILTSQTSVEVIQYFPMVERVIHDNKLSLVDVSEDSQERILETATATFGLVEMSLAELLKGWPGGDSSPQEDTLDPVAATSAADEKKSLALI